MLILRYEEEKIEKSYRLTEGTSQIGRLPSCDLVLNNLSVSRHHANVIVTPGGECLVQDVGSRFGTFINGEQLLAVQDPAVVAPGDTIKFGELTLTLEQNMPESDLLSEHHMISEGVPMVLKPVATPESKSVGAGDASLIKLLAGVGRALVSAQSLPDVLNDVVDMAFASVPAERAFLLLRDSADAALEARVLRDRVGTVPPSATLSRAVVRKVMRERVAILASDTAMDPGISVTDSILRFNIRSFMCAPLWSQDEVIGVLYLDSPKRGQFGAPDLDTLAALANAAAIAIEHARLSSQVLEQTRMRERLQRYHSPAVVSRIVYSTEAADAGPTAEERDVTVMFCDLVGFTTMCEPMTPVQAASLLNSFLTRMTDVVFEYEGTLDKFLGDALLAVFGAPFDQPDHPFQAVQAALAMRKALADLNLQLDQKLEMRIAISTGVALTGDIGSPRRREFTVLGDVVNTASRIENEVAKPGQIVISGETYARVKGRVEARPLKGKVLRGRTAVSEFYVVEG
jgi:adenylate cyclase